MTGRQWTTTSPSNWSSRRSTPWVEGCCGPMLTVSSSRSLCSRVSGVGCRRSHVLFPETRDLRHDTVSLARHGEVDRLRAEWLAAAQRMALPVIGQHDALQVRMPREAHAEQIEHFAFVPVGPRDVGGDAWGFAVGA